MGDGVVSTATQCWQKRPAGFISVPPYLLTNINE